MRRKPSGPNNGGYNNQNKRRYQGGSGGGEHRSQGSHHSNNRPRKNYPASREKYLAQARDALAAGDRVLAENYFQHAEHCYRMMVEEGYNTRPQPQQQPHNDQQNGDAQPQANEAEATEDHVSENTNALPAFLTASFEEPQAAPAEVPPVQNWEERDA